jgi:uncharacterized protein (TIGR03437 family)
MSLRGAVMTIYLNSALCSPLLLRKALLLLLLLSSSLPASSAALVQNTEEAYFLLEESLRSKDLFVVRVTDSAQIKKARDILTGVTLIERTTVPIGKLVKTPACYNPGWSYYLTDVQFTTGNLNGTTYRSVEDGAAERLGLDLIAVSCTVVKELPKPDCTGSIAYHVSAASYKRSNLTREGLVSAFGSNMTTRMEAAATIPLPTTLAGVTVTVEDSAGVKRLARLLFASPTQINYVMPLDTALGNATIIINDGQGRLTKGYEFIRQEGPGFFTANASGRGVAAGLLLKVKRDGTQAYEPLFEFDATKQEFVPRTVGFERTDEDYYLVFYGTGIRGYQQPETGYFSDGGTGFFGEVTYAGSQLTLAGLDQINIRLAKEAAGSGLVSVRFFLRTPNNPNSYRLTNLVEVKIGGVRATN